MTVSDPIVAIAPRPDPGAIRVVRWSIGLLDGRVIELAEAFYSHLFAMIPEVRRMFPEDMAEQRARLLSAMLASVDSVEDPDRMEWDLQRLGEIHYYRGIEDHQYQYVAHALVRAVRDVLPGEWSSELSSAWIGVYAWMIAHMVTGAQRARAQAESGWGDLAAPPT